MVNNIDETSNATVKNSFILLVGNVISLLVNAFGAILVARMLSPAEYGLYTVSLVLPNFLLIFTSWGSNQALIRFIAQRKINGVYNIKKLIETGYLLNFTTGSILSLLLYKYSSQLSSLVLNKPEVSNFLEITAFLILFQSIFNVSLAVFTGYEKMTSRASVLVLQSIVKGIFSPVLVFLGFGIIGGVTGHTISYFIAAILGLFLVIRIKNEYDTNMQNSSFIQNVFILIGFGLPLFLSQIFIGVTNQFRGVLLSWFISDEIIGNYGISTWFTALIGVVLAAIGTPMFPSFSKYNIKNEPRKTIDVYRWSIRYTSILIIPLICFIISSSKPLIYTVFGEKYLQAPFILSLQLVPSLFVGLGSISNYNLLISQGETRAALVYTIFGSMLTIFFSYSFIQFWGIVGLLASLIISSLLQNIFGIFILKRIYNAYPNIYHTFKTLVSSALCGVLSYLALSYFETSYPVIDLSIMAVVFFSSFFIIAPLMGAIEEKDIRSYRLMLKNIKIIYPIFSILLNFEKMIIDYKNDLKK